MAHGKGARVRTREKRAARKAAKQAEFAAKIGHASNKKKKGDQAGGKIWNVAPIAVIVFDRKHKQPKVLMFHGGSECGNVGCRRCNPCVEN